MKNNLLRRCIVVPAMAVSLGLSGCGTVPGVVAEIAIGGVIQNVVDCIKKDRDIFEEVMESKAVQLAQIRSGLEGRDATLSGYANIFEVKREFREDYGLTYQQETGEKKRNISLDPIGNYHLSSTGEMVKYSQLIDWAKDWKPTGREIPSYKR
ncbi:MAG: hypothetical protein WCK90_02020 [archaeon]